ncbi:DUF2461 domain-containing protein [Aliiroseovarius sp. YM-037]|uniref:DUF2461 domain-containing protein n=1 Tax=Aliiroseovarius sp. YM-037 TaxID=3341728 RepID=UPI003A7F643B
MTGFTRKTLGFLDDLSAHNDRDWFKDHKAIYEAEIKAPALAFGDQTAAALEAMTGLTHTPKLFRIHRDVRFSKDKTPYNTHVHMSFAPDTGQETPPVWMFGLGLKNLSLGVGIFGFGKQMLEDFRARVVGADGAKIAAMLRDLEASGARISEPALKRVPAGYDKDHPHAELLRYKGIAAWRDLDRSAAIGDDLPDRTVAEFTSMRPLFDYLRGV